MLTKTKGIIMKLENDNKDFYNIATAIRKIKHVYKEIFVFFRV